MARKSQQHTSEGKIIPAASELLQRYDTLFGISKNVARAIPNVKDGLKPVQRKILYTINEMGKPDDFKKVGSIIGEVLKIYAHGDVSIAQALIRMGTTWGNIVPFITSGGSYGSIMGDAAAAPRYIEGKLSPFARLCFFTDKLCIDMVPTYDNTKMEPETLPAMFPTAILNGVIGTGFGRSSNVPQYNLKDIIETTIKLIDNPTARCRLIPDSQWSCRIMSGKVFGKYKDSFDQIFETGYGSIVYKFQYQIDHLKNEVVVTALPPNVPLEDVLKEIERLQNERKYFPELKSMTDLSGKDHDDGIYVVFKLFEGKNPYRFVKKLESVNGFCKTFTCNVDLVDGLDVLHYSIRSYILAWYQYRKDYIRACLSTELTNVESDIAINDIKLFIFDQDHLDTTVEIYRSSKDHADIITRLMKEYSKSTGMTSQQAAILSEMAGKDYTKSALAKYQQLKSELQQKYDELTKTLDDPNGIPNIIKDQLKKGIKFSRPRGAEIVGLQDDQDVPDEKIILAIRPEKGTIAKLKESEESIKLISSLPTNLTAILDPTYNAIIFDNRGRYTILNPGQVPMMDNIESTVPLNRYIDNNMGTLVGLEALDDTCRSFIVVTKLGKMKKINPKNYQTRKNNVYITLDEGDEVVSVVGIKNEEGSIIVYTNQGNGQRLPASTIPVTSASALGSYIFNLPEGETIMGGFSVQNTDNLLVYVTRKGCARANLSKYFLMRKNKNDWTHTIETTNANSIVAILNCSARDTLHVVYSDLSEEDYPIAKLPVETMATKPRQIFDTTGKSIIRAKIVKADKKTKR